MIEPTPLPSDSPPLPFIAAVTDTNASGLVVPRLTTVAPIITVLIPIALASRTAAITARSAPNTRKAIDTTTNSNSISEC